MKVKFFTLVLTLASFLMSTQVSAQLIFEEVFDYPMAVGDTVVDSGVAVSPITGWYNQNDRPEYCLIDNQLTYPGYAASGIGKGMTIEKTNGQEVQKPFGQSITEGTVYLSFMLNASDCGAADPFMRLMKLSDDSNAQADIRARRNDTKDSIQFGTEGVYSDLCYVENETILMVLKYTFAGTNGSTSDTVALFVNPALGTEPSDDMAIVKKASSTTSTDLSIIRFRCKGNSVQAIVDGIRVATTWDELINTAVGDVFTSFVLSASCQTVSYEDIEFIQDEMNTNVYSAHDSIAYDSDVAIVYTPNNGETVQYIQEADPSAGESDTTIFTVTSNGNVETYKVAVARSEYQCKAGLLTGGSADKRPEGWLTTTWNYPSSSVGNGGLFPGDYIIRLKQKQDGLGSLTTPKFSQVGTFAFSAKFSESDSTEALMVLTSIDDAATWDTIMTYFAGEGVIPSYGGESSADPLGRISLNINEKDVMIRLQYKPGADSIANEDHRTGIDDITCKATDYVDIITTIATGTVLNADFEIYPNPASSSISIKGDVSNVSIYSVSGQLLKETMLTKNISIADLEAGIYLVKAGNSTKQLIVK